MTVGADKMGRLSDQYNRIVITTLRDRPIQPLVRELATNLSGLLRISVDAYYSTVSNAHVFNHETGEIEYKTRYGIVYPNTWGSINHTEFIRTAEDLEDLIAELGDDAFKTGIVENTFKRRNVLMMSNVRLNRLLAYQVIVRQYPASWLFKQ